MTAEGSRLVRLLGGAGRETKKGSSELSPESSASAPRLRRVNRGVVLTNGRLRLFFRGCGVYDLSFELLGVPSVSALRFRACGAVIAGGVCAIRGVVARVEAVVSAGVACSELEGLGWSVLP